MSRHDVHGGWVELREPEDVPQRLRRKVISAIGSIAADSSTVAALQASATPEEMVASVGGNSFDTFLGLQDVAILALVSAWSFGPQVDAATFDEIGGRAVDDMATLCMPLLDRMMPTFAPDPDPKATSASLVA